MISLRYFSYISVLAVLIMVPPQAFAQARNTDLPALPVAASSKTVMLKEVSVASPEIDTSGITEPATSPLDLQTRYSYGARELQSLFFTPLQVNALREALRMHEGRKTKTGDAEEPLIRLPEAQAVQKPKDLEKYPVFYLSTLAYKNSSDWSMWVSGYKITSKKNDTDLQIVSVSANAVQFAWTPSYLQILSTRMSNNSFASAEKIKNRLSKSSQPSVDESKATIYFTLKPNQSFSVGYFKIFEGFVEAPVMEPLAGSVGDAPTLQAPTAGAAVNTPADPDQAQMQTIMNNNVIKP